MASHIRIVVGFDGSADSWAAARFAVAEAASGHGVIRVVHSLLDRVAYAALLPPDLTADAPAEAHRLLDAARAELVRAAPGVDVQTVLAQRAPGAALVRASRSADVVVLGRHGHGRPPAGGGFRRINVGAVATHVLKYASGPVVVTGSETATGAGTGPAVDLQAGDDVGPVVLGLDTSAPSAAAIAYAFKAALRRGTSLRICCVRPYSGEPSDDAEARLALSHAIAGWRTVFADVPVALDVLQGIDPTTRLLDAAAGAALLVAGAQDRARLPRTAAVPDTLVRNAVCPVAVVRSSHETGTWSPLGGTSSTGIDVLAAEG
ncbi:universal stress protein [Dactylosporangium sp. CS-047395]|uniref:universal stress protein n=1 Tax=Dactylosporangium sp. CS-047395 TaxID=3239936 RepID=UPI003D93C892